jgi:hypothetical protein
MNLTTIGRGNVGGGLARRWAKAGHTVTLDETLAETDRINVSIRQLLDVQTEDWGVVVNLVELKTSSCLRCHVAPCSFRPRRPGGLR